jgi:RimJ/RimL family protein N-acetyltransferase
MMKVEPVELRGEHVVLRPLNIEHAQGLLPHALEPEIWLFMPYGKIDSLERVQWLIGELLGRQARGTDLCFTIFDCATDAPIGMTRYMTIEPTYYTVEIGGSWLGKTYRRTAANTESKYLLLRHAFETLGTQRVQFRSDLRNERSHRAIERLGAVREGVLRKQIRMPDGYKRSSVYFSIIEDEWQSVKANLEAMLTPQ